MDLSEHIVLIDKPRGITSFGVVARVRRMTGIKKVGHAGTLDPLATGLMVVGVGTGTKMLTNLVKLDKEYVAEILVGQQRSTGDMEGVILAEKTIATHIPDTAITTALNTLCGNIVLPVSAYSAIKVDGVPMYKRARAAEKKGEVAAGVPARAMRVDAVELLASKSLQIEEKSFQLVTVRFAVGSGTYIRSLAEEFGRRIEYPATLYNLRRTKVGEYDIADAVTLEQLATKYGTSVSY